MTNKILLIACALLCLVGCKDKKNEPNSLIGQVEKPDWVAVADYDLISSMTAVVQVDLSLSFPEEQLQSAQYQPSPNDILAVFADDECLGVGKEIDGLWHIYITPPMQSTTSTVILRYYSASLKNIFVGSELITYKNDTQLGSTDNPYIPKFVMEELIAVEK